MSGKDASSSSSKRKVERVSGAPQKRKVERISDAPEKAKKKKKRARGRPSEPAPPREPVRFEVRSALSHAVKSGREFAEVREELQVTVVQMRWGRRALEQVRISGTTPLSRDERIEMTRRGARPVHDDARSWADIHRFYACPYYAGVLLSRKIVDRVFGGAEETARVAKAVAEVLDVPIEWVLVTNEQGKYPIPELVEEAGDGGGEVRVAFNMRMHLHPLFKNFDTPVGMGRLLTALGDSEMRAATMPGVQTMPDVYVSLRAHDVERNETKEIAPRVLGIVPVWIFPVMMAVGNPSARAAFGGVNAIRVHCALRSFISHLPSEMNAATPSRPVMLALMDECMSFITGATQLYVHSLAYAQDEMLRHAERRATKNLADITEALVGNLGAHFAQAARERAELREAQQRLEEENRLLRRAVLSLRQRLVASPSPPEED